MEAVLPPGSLFAMLPQLHHTLCPSLYLGSLHLHRLRYKYTHLQGLSLLLSLISSLKRAHDALWQPFLQLSDAQDLSQKQYILSIRFWHWRAP